MENLERTGSKELNVYIGKNSLFYLQIRWMILKEKVSNYKNIDFTSKASVPLLFYLIE